MLEHLGPVEALSEADIARILEAMEGEESHSGRTLQAVAARLGIQASWRQLRPVHAEYIALCMRRSLAQGGRAWDGSPSTAGASNTAGASRRRTPRSEVPPLAAARGHRCGRRAEKRA